MCMCGGERLEIVLSPVAALDRQYATVGYGNTSFPTVVMIQKGTSSGG